MNNRTNSIASISARLRANPDCEALEHQLMSARFERSLSHNLEVSPEDAELLFRYTWSVTKTGYAQTGVDAPAEHANINGTKFLTTLNRLVLARMLGCEVWEIPSNIHADHIDEELGLANCRRENIQPLTATQNQKKKATRKARKGGA